MAARVADHAGETGGQSRRREEQARRGEQHAHPLRPTFILQMLPNNLSRSSHVSSILEVGSGLREAAACPRAWLKNLWVSASRPSPEARETEGRI